MSLPLRRRCDYELLEGRAPVRAAGTGNDERRRRGVGRGEREPVCRRLSGERNLLNVRAAARKGDIRLVRRTEGGEISQAVERPRQAKSLVCAPEVNLCGIAASRFAGPAFGCPSAFGLVFASPKGRAERPSHGRLGR